MLTAALLTIAITLNVLTFTALYRLWLWAKISAHIGTPFAILGSTVGLRSVLETLEESETQTLSLPMNLQPWDETIPPHTSTVKVAESAARDVFLEWYMERPFPYNTITCTAFPVPSIPQVRS